MASTPRSGLPEFWCSHLAKALSGDQPCQLATWLNGHFKLKKRPGREDALANWKANHSALLQQTAHRLREEGWKVDLERYFRVTGQVAILTGKVDLIAQAPNKRPLIVDCKSGQPRDSDAMQVMIEQIAIPLAWESPSMIFDGLVVYPTHTEPIKASAAAELKPKLFALLKKLGTMARPAASPSQSACRFCDVPDAECTERFREEDVPVVSTLEF